jgi:hypothetical protein
MGERPRSHHRKLTEAERRKHRARNADRDLWVALDFHTRTGRHRAKRVAQAWGLPAPLVDLIAHRYGRSPPRRPGFQELLLKLTHSQLRAIVRMHHARLRPLR